MTASQKEREEAIRQVCEYWAYQTKGYYLMSFWEMASHLNNYWHSPKFLSKNDDSNKENYHSGDHYAINSYDFGKLRRMISFTVRRINGARIEKLGYADFYFVPIKQVKK
jgi:hypothetical protein